ncbi:SRPBCC family protein [Neptunomonas sp. XY-337]|uniref:SRPBCC family protein n=1 Tax=Neptunomonas sp. XY-337 TaxID=2561897 RepID=UPI00145BDF2E|nr:SRPBCC family protein [Neptunomonas sp. XY-337]
MNKLLTPLILGTSLLAASTLHAETISVKESISLNSQPAAVWALVGDYNGLHRWHPAVKSSTQDGNIRILTLQNGAQFVETLTEQSDKQYSYMIDKSPLPVSRYNSTISVTRGPNGMAQVTWGSNFEANGVSADEAAEIVRGIYQAGLNNLQALYQ